MLPRGELEDWAADLLRDIAGAHYPGITHIEELDPQQQRAWIRTRRACLKACNTVVELAKTAGEAMDRQATAEDEEARERREAGRAQARAAQKTAEERHRANLEDQAQHRRERGALLDQGLKERETRRRAEERRDNLLMTITAASFLFTVVFAVIGALSGHVGAYGSSGVTFLFFVTGMRRLLL